MSFVHLHNHSEYSILDGYSRLETMVKQAKELGQPAIALTDHGTMGGIYKFMQLCKKYGIKGIPGCEVYITPGSRHDKNSDGPKDAYDHLTLLCEKNIGYQNLMKLVSLGYTEGFYYKPRIDFELLEKYKEGLICLTGCLGGGLAKEILRTKVKIESIYTRGYQGYLKRLFDIFGDKGNLFLEYQQHGIEEQEQVNHILDAIKKINFKGVATNDCHYTYMRDHDVHDIMLCCQTRSTRNNVNRFKFKGREFYLKSREEMGLEFSDELLDTTLLIAERCNVTIDPVKPEVYGDKEKDSYEQLYSLCKVGFKEKYPNRQAKAVERIKYELSVIKATGFASYFLVISDVMDYARRNNILCGYGRGSVVGSIVAYVVGITNVDPIRYGLLFERFLNPDRVTMPDIDLDFSSEDRSKIIQYIKEKYGEDKVAQIATYGTSASRMVIRDVGRALGLDLATVDDIAKTVPPPLFGLKQSLEDSLKNSYDLDSKFDKYPQLKKYSLALDGSIRSMGTHAAGVVISPVPLTDVTPLALNRDKEMVTQYDMKDLEALGLLKIDILGLKTLDVIKKTLKDGRKVRENDDATFALINRGQTAGVFQLEGRQMTRIARAMGIHSIKDIMALIALYRPGPMQFADEFVAKKRGRMLIEYDHPRLKVALQDTYGIILYQEQIMEILHTIGGFTYAEADIIRKIIGKKEQDKIESYRSKFCDHANFDSSSEVYDKIVRFASYGFNKSHAAGYAYLSYATAYLKTHYPLDFMCNLLNSEEGDYDKLEEYERSCKTSGIRMLPIDINYSDYTYSVSGNAIRRGFISVRGVGRLAGEEIVKNRQKDGPFKDYEDLCTRVRSRLVNKRVLTKLEQYVIL